MRTIKIALSLIIVFNLTVPALSFAQTQIFKQPQDMNEAVEVSEKVLETTQKEMPGLIGRIWQNEVLPVWQKMFNWAKLHIWQNWLSSGLKNIWSTTLRILKGEAEQRKPAIEEEFQKEKQELKEEAPQVGKSLWEKFKELIK